MVRHAEKCPWCYENGEPRKACNLEWSVVDDDFGQYVSPKMIRFCFYCGRKLEVMKSDDGDI